MPLCDVILQIVGDAATIAPKTGCRLLRNFWSLPGDGLGLGCRYKNGVFRVCQMLNVPVFLVFYSRRVFSPPSSTFAFVPIPCILSLGRCFLQLPLLPSQVLLSSKEP